VGKNDRILKPGPVKIATNNVLLFGFKGTTQRLALELDGNAVPIGYDTKKCSPNLRLQ